MTPAGHVGRAVSDPVGLIVDLVTAVEHGLEHGQVRAVVTGVAGGRAKSRRLAAALAEHPTVLADGRSPAPRAVGDLLIALRKAGARTVSPPCCAGCGKPLRTLQRRGQDWYCSVCGPQPEPCAACGNVRRIASRDRAGRPRCARCPDVGCDPIAVVQHLVLALDTGAGPEVIAAAVRRSAPRPSHQQKLAWVLEANPDLLTGQGHRAPIPAVLRLIDLLDAAGITGIVRPSCPRCHRQVRLAKPLDGQRVCRTCIARSRIEECIRCGARREPATRDDQGRPLCPNCLVTDPANLELCLNCGRPRPVGTRTPDGPLCPGCPALPLLTCSICGAKQPCGISRATGLPWCPACQRRPAACSRCGRLAAIASGTLTRPLCADCTAPAAWRTCTTCSDPGYPHPGQCARCLLSQHLGDLLGPPAASRRPGLGTLRENLAATAHPGTAMRWLAKPAVATVLSDLAAGRRALTHQALDELPATAPLAHLRQVLVATGALPERDEHMARLERFLDGLLASRPDPGQRKVLHHYTNWHLVRRLRSRNNGKHTTVQQFGAIRQRAQAAIVFLDWLGTRDLTLDTCQQADLDRWLADESATYRRPAGHFIRWAHASKLTTVRVAAVRWNGPTQPLDDQHRWDIARRLLNDDGIKPEDRLAGLFLLLYAQGPAAVSRMTTGHIQLGSREVHLCLGQAPIVLPEPVASLARTVIANRKGHATIGALNPSGWLFPGGQPGRPISATQLTVRLTNLGIRPNQARSTALFQLAAEIPAAILARTLGIHTDVAVTWQRLSAGDWGTYAADVSRRTSATREFRS